ncbi:hypothetical protein BDU57DRAFT_523816 [Ampelomyces quisqualis]|uniref:Uncharacterized protein n=1 Tax=Ampelomyces quisqualis TaxID=50730 RepID=A0A6A5QAG2_AMPQU|nr:hypothetical protein BDU57DRAFT_523816 [Ampelomyces quisqualis]
MRTRLASTYGYMLHIGWGYAHQSHYDTNGRLQICHETGWRGTRSYEVSEGFRADMSTPQVAQHLVSLQEPRRATARDQVQLATLDGARQQRVHNILGPLLGCRVRLACGPLPFDADPFALIGSFCAEMSRQYDYGFCKLAPRNANQLESFDTSHTYPNVFGAGEMDALIRHEAHGPDGLKASSHSISWSATSNPAASACARKSFSRPAC